MMNDSQNNLIRVVLIGHDSIVQYGLEMLINTQQSIMKSVGSFISCSAAIPCIENLSPNVIILSLNCSSENELQVILQFITSSKAKILILKRVQDSEIYDRAILAGAKGLIEKDEPLHAILKAIEKVNEGQLWLNQTYIKKLVNKLSQEVSERGDIQEENKIEKLTPREKKIFFTLVENAGLPAKVISNKLNISESTFRNHLTSIYEKLDVSNKLGLWNYVLKHKLRKK